MLYTDMVPSSCPSRPNVGGMRFLNSAVNWFVPRPLMLNGLLIFVGQGSAGQVALGCFFCTLMAFVHVHMKPYHDSVQNLLAMLCLVHLAGILFVGLLFKVNTVKGGSASSDVITYLIIVLNALVFIVPLIDKAYNLRQIGWKINVIWNRKKHAKWIAKHANINSIPAQLPCTDNVEVEVRVDESSSASGSVTEHSMDPPVLGLFIEQDVSSDQYNPACMDDASTPRSASGVPAENNVGIEV